MREGFAGGQSLTAPLRRVLVCSPEAAGWQRGEAREEWRSLGYLHEPDAAAATTQHRRLRALLQAAGAEVLELPAHDSLTLDAVYAHDASFPTDAGVILMHMGKPARRGEPARHAALYRALQVPILGEIQPPGHVEAGDLVWLDGGCLLIGRTYRTNAAGIGQMRDLLQPHGVEVRVASLPHGQGPDTCLHLMSLLSMLDERTALVDRAWLAVDTIELLRERGFDLIDIDVTERERLACNVVSLGRRRLIALEENPATTARLRAHGFEVFTFAGDELCQNGSGGPTCLTRPVWRAQD